MMTKHMNKWHAQLLHATYQLILFVFLVRVHQKRFRGKKNGKRFPRQKIPFLFFHECYIQWTQKIFVFFCDMYVFDECLHNIIGQARE